MILVLGYLGYRTNKLDGQTVKTRDVFRLAKEQYGDGTDFFDTEELKFNKLSVFKMLAKVVRCEKLLYLPAHGNLKYMFPVLFCLASIFRVKIHYVVIGGWLREYIATLPLHRWMLARISCIYVETQRLKSELEEFYQLRNIKILSNFRFFNHEPQRMVSDKLRVVFMARINKMKGLDWIFYLADYIVKNKQEDKYTFTFYGQINKDDEEYFYANLSRYVFMEYKGALQPDAIYETLSSYDVLLLPTHFYTEGLPGSIVDAYISGLPVIATSWKYANEFVEDGVTGFIIPFEKGEDALVEKVELLENDRKLLSKMQANVLGYRKRFAPPMLPL